MMKAFLSLSIFTAFVLSGQVSYAALYTCERLFDSERAPIKSEVVVPKEEIEKKISAFHEQFAPKPDSWRTRIRTGAAIRMANAMTNLLVRLHTHTYPFSYLRDGTVLKVRFWAKTGDADIRKEIEGWLGRYQSYRTDQRLITERTAFVHLEVQTLKELLKKSRTDFPILVQVPRYLDDGVHSDPIVFESRKEVAKELLNLAVSENTRLNSLLNWDFSRGRFLRGRSHEQAHLEALLKVVLQEMKAIPTAAGDAQLRRQLMGEIESSLSDPTLAPPGASRYVEARRALTDEIAFFSGHRELSGTADKYFEKLTISDQDDLGIDREKLGLVNRLGRAVLLQAPKLAVGLALLSATPYVKYEIKTHLFREAYMQELAELPAAKYGPETFQFMKRAYGVREDHGQLIYPAKAQAAMDHIRQLRRQHLAELRKEQVSQDDFARTLEFGSSSASAVTGAEFRQLMLMKDSEFPKAAVAISKREKTPAAQRDLLDRLLEARENYQDALTAEGGQEKVSSGKKTDAVVGAFSGFLLGGATAE